MEAFVNGKTYAAAAAEFPIVRKAAFRFALKKQMRRRVFSFEHVLTMVASESPV
jgi:GH24 family phage-related lysozyme (muramidase)